MRQIRRGRWTRAERERRLQAVRRMRAAYEAGGVLADLGASAGVGEATLRKIAKAEGWSIEARAVALAARRAAQIEVVSPVGRVVVTDGHAVCRVCGERREVRHFRRTNRGGECLRSICRRCLKRRHARRRGEAKAAQKAARAEVRARARHLLSLRRLLRALLLQRCDTEGRSVDAVEYKARWERDPGFRERERMRQKAYKHANPDKAAAWGDRRKRQAAEQSDGTLTPDVVRRLFAEATLCPYCAIDMHDDEKTLDHMHPVSRGGAHSLANVVVCCRRCNIEKRDMRYGDWLLIVMHRAGVHVSDDMTTCSAFRVLPASFLDRGSRAPHFPTGSHFST